MNRINSEVDNHLTMLGKLGLVLCGVLGGSGIVMLFVYPGTGYFYLGLTFIFIGVVLLFLSGILVNKGYDRVDEKSEGGNG